jgi:hypothetical protein
VTAARRRRESIWVLESVRVETFKSGPRAGQRKPIKLPKGAIPVSVVSSYGLTLYYLVVPSQVRP